MVTRYFLYVDKEPSTTLGMTSSAKNYKLSNFTFCHPDRTFSIVLLIKRRCRKEENNETKSLISLSSRAQSRDLYLF
jgi:hypothetical protein